MRLQPVPASRHRRRGVHRVGAGREVDADRHRRAGRSAASRCPCSARRARSRATSRSRSTEPSGLARMTMAPNCAGVTSRPWVCRLNWNCWSLPIGRAPMRPIGATTFCAWIAAMMSPGVRLEADQPVGVEPHAHRVVQLAEQVRLADARRARQLVQHVDQHVVGDEQRIHLRIVAVERQELQDRRWTASAPSGPRAAPPAAVATARSAPGC